MHEPGKIEQSAVELSGVESRAEQITVQYSRAVKSRQGYPRMEQNKLEVRRASYVRCDQIGLAHIA